MRALAARCGAGCVLTDLSPAAPSYADHPLVARLVSRTGAAVEPKQAWTDVARLGAMGIDAVNYGPGETAQAHQANESAGVPALEDAYRKLRVFLTSSSS